MVKYKNYTSDNKEYDTILGIPTMEALKVLTLYKENNKHYSSKDYVRGFEDGYNRAYSEMQKTISEITHGVELK